MTEQISRVEKKLGARIVSVESIGGGCIGESKKIKTSNGNFFFLKTYSQKQKGICLNESNGLKELSKAKAIKIPKVICEEDTFLLLEFIHSGPKPRDFFQQFGQQFAALHHYQQEKFGFYENNYIGGTIQKNLPLATEWLTFYLENRLRFQFQLAEEKGYLQTAHKLLFLKLAEKLPTLLAGSEEPPTLLHGDLWGGNFLVCQDGNPCLIDPAVYYGHREADLAMTKLFGGFSSTFYEAYNESFPLAEGYKEREDLYKLYHIMNHLNLFGMGYYSQAVSILKYYAD